MGISAKENGSHYGKRLLQKERKERDNMSKAEIHKEICDKLNATYRAKNADYGDSFAELRQEYPNAILIRLTDKLKRLKTLSQSGEQQVKDESIDDTLLDLANYCIMELVERKLDD